MRRIFIFFILSSFFVCPFLLAPSGQESFVVKKKKKSGMSRKKMEEQLGWKRAAYVRDGLESIKKANNLRQAQEYAQFCIEKFDQAMQYVNGESPKKSKKEIEEEIKVDEIKWAELSKTRKKITT